MIKLLPVLLTAATITTAQASLSIQFDVTGPTTLAYELSGTTVAPAGQPENEGYIIFIDITGPVQASYIDITGDARIGNTNGVNTSYVGFPSAVYDKPLQLRFVNYIQDGEAASGSGEVTFNVPHGLTNSMFIDGVTGIYLGTNGTSPNATDGVFQGYASALVPEPATYAGILGLGVLAVAMVARRRKRA
ncbi:PEP-CTERM sorting domain-containing protein [Cerasicoccus fimbriatus]|uniref:PEP-CTERM sorting domain-containing protein n=1 Tax=Cerasicoccus fimbriatus TaxID=3014554 RepID=UPI0022B2B665|nr:PEP-CTERM sorting domain-containing protein [Cerasicoccus sp. TK19100]